MKTNIILLIAFVILAVNSSCEKDNDDIKYPKNGDYGENIIQIDSLDIVSSGDGMMDNNHYYSLRAELPIGTSVKIIMKNKSIGYGSWFFSLSSQQGWSIDNYNTNTDSQQFFAYGQVICDLKIFFAYSGSAEIEIYENKDTIPNRIKTIYW
jgi:hypothetical protein